MNKLYNKSELSFTILWIIIYVVGTSIFDNISNTIGLHKLFTFIYLILLTYIIIIFLKKNKLFKKYGLCKSEVSSKKLLYYLPLIFIMTCNVWFGISVNNSIIEILLYIASMFCVGFIEEIIFRGFLFKTMSKDNVKFAIIVSSVTFGIGHIVNLINGSGADVISNLCQVGYAMAGGFMFVSIFYKSKSIWPCITSHSIINALSIFNNTTGINVIISSIILFVVSSGYGIYILKNIKNGDEL